MSNPHPILIARPPFAGMTAGPSTNLGVTISDRDGLGIATILARKGRIAALAQRMREQFSIELPQGPHRTAAGHLALAGTGPGAWLATSSRGGNAFAQTLRETIGEVASVSDQSDGYAVLRLSGPKVRDTLLKLVPVDVHPRTFKVGNVASTVASHMGVTLWRLEDGNDGASMFEIAIFRSLAASFWHAAIESAAEFAIVTAQS